MGKPDGITVGDGATISVGSDRYPATVIEVVQKNKVVVQRDRTRKCLTPTNGITDAQKKWLYERDKDGRKDVVTKRKDGSWRVRGSKISVSFGKRSYYQDPHF